MISIKNICLSQTSKTLVLVVFAISSLLISGCAADTVPSGLELKFFPVSDKNTDEVRLQPFGNEPVLLRLDAKQKFTSQEYVSSVLQPILGEPLLFCDRHLFFKGDSLPANSNIFPSDLCKLETIQITGAKGNTYDNHYIFNLNSDLDTNFVNQNNGFYQFKVIAFTTDRLTILDSISIELK